MSSDALPDDAGTLKAMLLAERMQNERLRQIIKELQRHRFGRRAETLPEDQMLLGLEDVEQSLADEDAAKPMTPAERSARAERRRRNRGSLPAHLPRVELIVDINDKTCPCCQRELHCIGEDRSERLDIVPVQFRVLVTVRPKYACRKCEDGVLQAAAPARLIDGGLPADATVAQVLVSKYADHLPLYRQAQIYARQGINLDRSTLADWVGHAAWHLRPLHERLLARAEAKAEAVCRRDDGASAGSRPRPHENRPVLGLRRRRQAMGRNRSAGCCLCLRIRSHVGTSDESSRGLHGYPAGRRLCRLPQARQAQRRPACLLLVARPARLL